MVTKRFIANSLVVLSVPVLMMGCAAHQTQIDPLVRAEARAREAEDLLDEVDLALERQQPDRAVPLLARADEVLRDPAVDRYPEHALLRARAIDARGDIDELRVALREQAEEEVLDERRARLGDQVRELQAQVRSLEDGDWDPARARETQELYDQLKLKLVNTGLPPGDHAVTEARAAVTKAHASFTKLVAHRKATHERAMREVQLAARQPSPKSRDVAPPPPSHKPAPKGPGMEAGKPFKMPKAKLKIAKHMKKKQAKRIELAKRMKKTPYKALPRLKAKRTKKKAALAELTR